MTLIIAPGKGSAPFALDEAMRYCELGWQVVLLHPKRKNPIGTDWPSAATDDADKIAAAFERHPNANVGVLMGERSGIIDFEGDGPDAEKTLSLIFGGDVPVTPTYQSRRGKHRLLRYRGDLPEQEKNGFKIGDLEIRTGYGGKAAQSMFPPSIHPDTDEPIQWLVRPEDCDPAEISDAVQAWLWNWYGEPLANLDPNRRASKHDWRKIATEGVSEGERNNTLVAFVGKLLSDMADPFDNAAVGRILALVKHWNDATVKPPMDDDELKTSFDSIVALHRKQVSCDAPPTERSHGGSSSKPSAQRLLDDVKLAIVYGAPKVFRLISPIYHGRTPDGYIELTGAQFLSARAVKVQSAEQACVAIRDKGFTRRWPRKCDELMDNHQRIEADPDDRRGMVVAEALLAALQSARLENDAVGLDRRGDPVRRSDGSIWFQVGTVHEDIGYTLAKIKQSEIVAALRAVGAQNRTATAGGVTTRFKVLDTNSLGRLRDAAGCSAKT